MPIPEFQAMMLPVLQVLADGNEHRHSDLATAIATQLNLTSDDLAELLPSGKQKRFDNRVRWAVVHLRKARLVANATRGLNTITDRGRAVLAGNLTRVDMKVLEQYSEYRDFRDASPESESPSVQSASTTTAVALTTTPDEQMEVAFQQLRNEVAQELLETLRAGSWQFFEKVVVDLLVAMGYGGSLKDAGRVVGRSGDGGIDGTINEDRLGLDVVYVQAKRWEGTVGRPTVHGFAGSLDGARSKRGVMITTSNFSRDARDYVNSIEKRIVLIDGEQLVSLMIEHGVGVSTRQTYVVKRIDRDYFIED